MIEYGLIAKKMYSTELSTYVRDPVGKTRIMIVEARSNKSSMDPIGIITKKSKHEHSLNNNTITISIESDDDSYIKIESPIPEVKAITFAIREWIKTND